MIKSTHFFWVELEYIPHNVFLKGRIVDPDRTSADFLAVQDEIIVLSSYLLLFSINSRIEIIRACVRLKRMLLHLKGGRHGCLEQGRENTHPFHIPFLEIL